MWNLAAYLPQFSWTRANIVQGLNLKRYGYFGDRCLFWRKCAKLRPCKGPICRAWTLFPLFCSPLARLAMLAVVESYLVEWAEAAYPQAIKTQAALANFLSSYANVDCHRFDRGCSFFSSTLTIGITKINSVIPELSVLAWSLTVKLSRRSEAGRLPRRWSPSSYKHKVRIHPQTTKLLLWSIFLLVVAVSM